MLEIVKTADGSNTIYNSQVGENYHSKNGALQESKHVFINSGLLYFLDNIATQLSVKESTHCQPTPQVSGDNLAGPINTITILEVGFGTGLNFLLSADACTNRKINLNYTGIEAHPLSKEMICKTGYNDYVSPELWQQFNFNYEKLLLSSIILTPYCKLQIANCELLNFHSKIQYDIIYFDAFAVARQPEMWDQASLAHTIKFLKLGGVFVTYAITGNLKRALKILNCKIEKIPGAAGKREMLRAVKLAEL